MLECVQQPGEVVYVPPLWWHATSNMGDTVAVGAQARKMGALSGDFSACAAYNHLVALAENNSAARLAHFDAALRLEPLNAKYAHAYAYELMHHTQTTPNATRMSIQLVARQASLLGKLWREGHVISTDAVPLLRLHTKLLSNSSLAVPQPLVWRGPSLQPGSKEGSFQNITLNDGTSNTHNAQVAQAPNDHEVVSVEPRPKGRELAAQGEWSSRVLVAWEENFWLATEAKDLVSVLIAQLEADQFSS